MNITKNIQKQRIDHKGPPGAVFGGLVSRLWVVASQGIRVSELYGSGVGV